MGRAYKVVPAKEGLNLPFQLMFIGNFKAPASFRQAVLNKSMDGQFCLIHAGEKHFLTIKNGKVTDEEVRYGKKSAGQESGEPDIADRDLPTE